MAGKIFGKIMDIFCLDEDTDEMEEMETSEFETQKEDYELSKVDKGKVVNIHTNSSAKVVISKPYDFEEAAAICDNLKSRKIVIINISALDQKVGQRLLDFIGGASYIVGGEIQEVEKGIYILSPSNVEVSNSLKFELQSKGVFSFAK